MKVALLDDYQQVALQSADWDSLSPECSVAVFHDHLTDESAIADRLNEFDVRYGAAGTHAFSTLLAHAAAQPQANCQRRDAERCH